MCELSRGHIIQALILSCSLIQMIQLYFFKLLFFMQLFVAYQKAATY